MATGDTHTGKVAFVTGAGAGIGRATALAFAREGASVAAIGIPEASTQETARLIEDDGGRARSRQNVSCRRRTTSRRLSTKLLKRSAVSTSPSTMLASSSLFSLPPICRQRSLTG